jgi:hypothetical protein
MRARRVAQYACFGLLGLLSLVFFTSAPEPAFPAPSTGGARRAHARARRGAAAAAAVSAAVAAAASAADAGTGRARLLLIGDSVDLEAANAWCQAANGTRFELRLRGGSGRGAVLTERNAYMRNAPPILPWGDREIRLNNTLPLSLFYHCWWTVFCDAPSAAVIAMRYPFGSSATGPYHDDGGCGGGSRPGWRDGDDGPDWRGSADAVDAVAAQPLPHDAAAVARALVTPMVDAAAAAFGGAPHLVTFTTTFWELAGHWLRIGGRDPAAHPADVAFSSAEAADAFAARWRANASAMAAVLAAHPLLTAAPRTAVAWRLANPLHNNGCGGRQWWCGMSGVAPRADAALQASPFPLPFIPFSELPFCTQNRDPVHPMPQCLLSYVDQLLAHIAAVRGDSARARDDFRWQLKAADEPKI